MMDGKFMNWTNEEKARMFDEISKHYYNKNFGTFSKSDMDLLMFHFYLQKLVDDNKDEKGQLNYNQVSDYKISNKLGITQSRVKSLKIKKQLIYPIEYEWKTAFASLIPNARYDETKKLIILSVADPNLFIEIDNYIEENGGYIEYQLNGKLLQMRVEFFVELAILAEDESNKGKIIKKLKEQIKKSDKDENIFDEKNIGKSLIKTGVDIVTIVTSLATIAQTSGIFPKLLSVLQR